MSTTTTRLITLVLQVTAAEADELARMCLKFECRAPAVRRDVLKPRAASKLARAIRQAKEISDADDQIKAHEKSGTGATDAVAQVL